MHLSLVVVVVVLVVGVAVLVAAVIVAVVVVVVVAVVVVLVVVVVVVVSYFQLQSKCLQQRSRRWQPGTPNFPDTHAQDAVEKAVITSEMITAGGDDMDEVRQAVWGSPRV